MNEIHLSFASEIHELEALLALTPEDHVIERRSLESRLKSARASLAQLLDDRHLAEKAPLATGAPPPEGYADWLAQLKAEITQRRQRAALAANAELVGLYARIGRDILDRQHRLGWGAKVIDRLAGDLKAAFPDIRGFSSRNLKYMAYFAEHCPDERFGQQPAAQLPWFPNPTHAVGAQFIAPNRKHPDASIRDDSCTTKPGAMNRAPTVVRCRNSRLYRFGQQPADQMLWFRNPTAHAVGAQFIAPDREPSDASILDDSCTTKPGAMNRAPTIVRRGTTT